MLIMKPEYAYRDAHYECVIVNVTRHTLTTLELLCSVLKMLGYCYDFNYIDDKVYIKIESGYKVYSLLKDELSEV